uniref:Uncharacterized protein n=1 Tax=Megaselia scalaris TaxID=36166 RepID=T1H3U2_MEGSC
MDPLGSICSSQHEGDILEEEADNEEDRDDVLDELNEIDEEEEEDKMCNSDVKSSPSEPTKRDISAVKRELSLNLDGVAISSAVGLSTKMAVDLTDISPGSASLILNKQTKAQLNVPQIQSPSNSIFTTTSAEDEMTSQSVTPSEFGYQHLNRQSNVISSLENSPNSYENLEVAFLNETRKLIPPPSPKR